MIERRHILRRISAFLILLGWFWLSMGAPFGHNHLSRQGERALPGISSGAPCLACQWMTVEKTAEVITTPSVLLPFETQQEFPSVELSAGFVSIPHASSRAPPA